MQITLDGRKVIYFFYTLTLFFFHAYLALGVDTPGAGGVSTEGRGGVSTQGSGAVELVNPLKSQTITELLLKIIDVLLTFALPIIVFFIMFGGFKLVTARGDTGQIEDGKKAITWAVIGGVVVLASKLIIQVIQGTVSAL